MDNDRYDLLGYAFLGRVYPNWHLSVGVMHTALPSDTPNEKIAKYLERLARVIKKAFKKDHHRAMIKELYYRMYVIKPEDIPETYFELQKRIALERGMGHLEYTEKEKNEEIEHIISEQKESLDNWLEYFVSSDTDNYPLWFKCYAFLGMVKLGAFDKAKGSFSRRTASTVKPFIELDREALAFIYDYVKQYLTKGQIEDEELEKLVANGNFGKLYGYALKKFDGVKKDINSDDGIWKKYLQGSDPEILYNDIHGKGTGWCTAGGLETAAQHLRGGDFYVYFTKGSDGEYSQPRIAIRKKGSKIAEIRGIGPNQNLESNMEKVVERKLQEEDFPDRDEYKRKVEDMQMMTYIYTKWQNKGELTKEDLRFLYEIDRKIMGFGWNKDPRIKEILDSRSKRKDLALIFNCDEKQISTTTEEALSGGIIYHYGNLNLSCLTTAKGLKLPEHVGGSLYLNRLTTAEGLELPKYVEGILDLRGLTTAKGLKLPEHIGGSLDLSGLTTAKGLELPEHVGGDLDLGSLTTTKGLKLPKHIGGGLNLGCLTTAEGLKFPEHIGGNLYLDGLTTAEGLHLPEHVEGSLSLDNLTVAKGLKLPKHIGGHLYLTRLITAEGLELPEHITDSLFLSCLPSFEGAILPHTKEGRELLLKAVKSGSPKLVISLEQEYNKNPIEEQNQTLDESGKKLKARLSVLRSMLDKIRGKAGPKDGENKPTDLGKGVRR